MILITFTFMVNFFFLLVVEISQPNGRIYNRQELLECKITHHHNHEMLREIFDILSDAFITGRFFVFFSIGFSVLFLLFC